MSDHFCENCGLGYTEDELESRHSYKRKAPQCYTCMGLIRSRRTRTNEGS